MIKEIATTCMLIGAIAPFKEQILNNTSLTVNLSNTQNWEIITNTNEEFEKSQFNKIQTYENNVIKVEEVKFTYYRETTTSQYVESYTFTRITPKIELNTIDIYTNGFDQTYVDAQSITTGYNKTYGYEYWRVTQNGNNTTDFDLLFNLNNYESSIIINAYDDFMEGTELNNEVTVDALYYYGNSENNYVIEDNTIVYMEFVHMMNIIPSSVTEMIWNKNYDFFYGQPYKTTINYNWYIDPAEQTNYEVIDVGNLMLTILGMPMAWITQAFNFTLWPGTQYAINVGHVLSAVIIASIIIIVLKKVYR